MWVWDNGILAFFPLLSGAMMSKKPKKKGNRGGDVVFCLCRFVFDSVATHINTHTNIQVYAQNSQVKPFGA